MLLGDHLSLTAWLAILVATSGILLMSWKPGTEQSLRPALLGLVSAALFGMAAVGFRGGIRTLDTPSFVMAATTTLAVGLAMQTAVLTAYLAVTDRAGLLAILKAWRPSLVAGFLGAFASQFWFIGFS